MKPLEIKLRKGLDVNEGALYLRQVSGDRIVNHIDKQVIKHRDKDGYLKKQIKIRISIQ